MPIPAEAILGGVELGKFFLMLALETMRQSGKTEAEIEALYNQEKTKFFQNAPSTLPDV